MGVGQQLCSLSFQSHATTASRHRRSQAMIAALSFIDRNILDEFFQGFSTVIQYGKKNLSPELPKSYINVEELAVKCCELASEGVAAAQRLLRDLHMLIFADEEAAEPMKRHKSAQ